MDVSVVIPVKDRAHLIGRCLDSVAAQTLQPSHVYVVDNASTDNTLETMRQWANAHPEFPLTLLSETTPGASAARNCGLAHVDTEYVYFFDSDDEMMPRLLERAAATIGDADLVYWKGEVVNLKGKHWEKTFHDSKDFLRNHFYNSILSTQLYIIRTQLIRDVGEWNTDASVWNDWELGVRIALAEPRVVCLPEVLTLIHAQKNSITGVKYSHRIGDWENTLDIAERAIFDSDRTAEEITRLRLMLIYRRVNLAALYRREGNQEAAKELLESTLADERLDPDKRFLLRFAYYYTAFGGRGAYYFF